MSTIYLISIGAPAGYFVSINKNISSSKVDSILSFNSININTLFVTMTSIFISSLMICAWELFKNEKVSYLLLSLASTLFVGATFFRIPALRNMDGLSWVVMYKIISVILSFLFTGLNRGQEERRNSADYYANKNMSCDNYIILRSASDKFIAIDGSGYRYIINESCEKLFSVPPKPLFD